MRVNKGMKTMGMKTMGRMFGNCRLTLGASFVVLALLATTVVGSASSAPTTISACVNNASGTVKIVAAGDTCKGNDTLMTWNTQGPQGPAGPAGPVGPAG